jgi:hypothetical protein
MQWKPRWESGRKLHFLRVAAWLQQKGRQVLPDLPPYSQNILFPGNL